MYSDSYVSAHAALMLDTCDLTPGTLSRRASSHRQLRRPAFDGSAGGLDSDYRTYTPGSVPGRYWSHR